MGCVLTVIMIMAGYLGAVSVVTTVKWFWFVIAMALFVPVSLLHAHSQYMLCTAAHVTTWASRPGRNAPKGERRRHAAEEILSYRWWQVLYSLAVTFREAAVQRGGEIADVYGKVAWLTIIAWIFYP